MADETADTPPRVSQDAEEVLAPPAAPEEPEAAPAEDETPPVLDEPETPTAAEAAPNEAPPDEAAPDKPALEEPAPEEKPPEKPFSPRTSVQEEPHNPQEVTAVKAEGAPTPKTQGKDVKALFNSKGSLTDTESFVREKLEDFKEKRVAVAAMIKDLQNKVKEFREKENPSEEDTANLKKYHAAFLEKLGEYEEMTRNVERLMGMADVPTSQLDMTMSGPPITKPAKPPVSPEPEKPKKPSMVDSFCDEKLPKLIVCGTDMGDAVPRIIVCEPLKKSDMEPFHKSSPRTDGVDGNMMNKLNECFETQQKLAAENAQMAQMRHQLQEELLDKQDLLDSMRQKMMSLESEKYRLCAENKELQTRLGFSQKPGSPLMCKRELFMKLKGVSPGVPSGPSSPTGPVGCCQENNMQDLEQELEKMEGDVQSIYCELENIQKDKLALGYPAATPLSTSPRKPVCKRMLPHHSTQTDEDKEKDIFFESDKDPKYKELREQYQRLHSDFKNKVTEVAALRVDLEKTKTELDEITILHHELESMYQREIDQNNESSADKYQIQSYKERLLDLEQQTNIAKQMYMSGQEEIEEMRSLVEEQANQLDEYRNKYLKTLQQAEELKKENEFKERECADQIAFEIQKVKSEMQEQLEELSPIKDLLKITQQKLKETEQMHTIALDTIADMSQKLEDAQNEVQVLKSKVEESETGGDIQANLQFSLEEAEKKMTEIEKENAQLKDVVSKLEAHQNTQNQRLEEKCHEVLQLNTQLETLREESGRQVARVKERSEMIRKCLQAQISEMEREVAQCRAAAAFANRERDEMKSKLQMEICLLSENFRDSQNRILQLQQHVNYLSAAHPTSLIDLVQ